MLLQGLVRGQMGGWWRTHEYQRGGDEVQGRGSRISRGTGWGGGAAGLVQTCLETCSQPRLNNVKSFLLE